MKKSLLALAVLGAFAGAASAQTNVTIYGVVDANITYSDSGAATNNKTWSLNSGTTNGKAGNRLGFKGSEDLGGGLSAIFTLENGFDIDTGALAQSQTTADHTKGPAVNRLFGRQAFVGLQGAFGAVKLGRQYTPMHLALDGIDPFHTNLAGNIENVFSGYGVRTDNTVNYSLTSGPISGQVAYTFGEQAGSFSTGRQFGLSVGYANGPINAVLAYHNVNKLIGAGTTASAVPVVTAADPIVADGQAKGTLLGGTYDFGVVKAHAAYAWDKGNTEAGVDNVDNRNYMLGVSAPVGAAGSVLASFNRKDDRLATDNDIKAYALGYLHSLSKRTTLYTSINRIDNKNVPDTKQFNMGVNHTF